MDEATKSAWKQFLKGPGGVDLMQRFVANEVKHLAEGAKSDTVDGKAIGLAKYQAVYEMRSGIASIMDESKPAPSQLTRAGSK